MDMENLKVIKEPFIMEIGSMIFNLELDMKSGKIKLNMKENIIMELKMGLDAFLVMEYKCIVGNGKIIIWKDLEFIIIQMEENILENGKII